MCFLKWNGIGKQNRWILLPTLMFVIKKKKWISPLKEKFNNLNIYINLLKWMVYLQTTYELCFGEVYFEYFESCDFSPRKYKYYCIRVYVWFKDVKHVIWMWIWLILKNISLLDRIWSLWLVRFAHSPTNFIFWFGRLIFSVSINSHPSDVFIISNVTYNHSLHW